MAQQADILDLEVRFQLEFGLRSWHEALAELEALPDGSGGPAHVFWRIQSFVFHAGVLSYLFFGARNTFASELRNRYGVSDDSPLKDRTLRDAFTHVDERLDKLRRSPGRIDFMNIGPRGFTGAAGARVIRNLDQRTLSLQWLDQEVDLGPISREMERLALFETRRDALADLCRTYRVARLELFGSALNSDFDARRSDLDFLVEFAPAGPMGPFRQFIDFQLALERLFERQVDLVEVGAMDNPYFIRAVTSAKRVLYAA